MEKGCQKGSPEAPTGGQLLPTDPPPTAPVSSCPSGHLCGYSGTSTPPIGGPGPGPGPVFYLSSYTHHSYRRARARPGPGILSFITIYPSLLLAGILSFITIYPSLLLAGILSFITIYPSLHYTKKWPGRVSWENRNICCLQATQQNMKSNRK